jgi:tripartite-type tricarboxylate transporter receptor subunit TctC
MLAGETHVTFIGLGFAMPQIKAGKAIPLSVTASKRSKTYPDIPSLAEEVPDSGLGDTWFGVFMPAGTPQAIVDQVNREFVKALRTPKVDQFFAARGMETVGDSSQEFTAFLKRERGSAATVFKTLGMKASAGPF